MTTGEFYELLEADASIEEKLDCCEHFLQNYPVRVFTVYGVEWTKLIIKINRNKSSAESIDKAYKSLRDNLSNLKNYDTLYR